ncbi:hypothetical protein SB775_33990, partial [Peribacillus sp. SIMBA_075]
VELLATFDDRTNAELDDKLETFTQLIDQRDELLSHIKPPFTGEEQQLGGATMLLNEQVDRMLDLQKLEIRRDIQEI